MLAQEPQTFASFVAVCANCGQPYTSMYLDKDGRTKLNPCHHAAALKLIENPLLRQP